jgi:hypothetical protein
VSSQAFSFDRAGLLFLRSVALSAEPVDCVQHSIQQGFGRGGGYGSLELLDLSALSVDLSPHPLDLAPNMWMSGMLALVEMGLRRVAFAERSRLNLYSITTNQAAIVALFRASTATWATCRRCRASFPTIRPRSCATRAPSAS